MSRPVFLGFADDLSEPTMVQSPKKPRRALRSLADRVEDCFPPQLADLMATGPGRRVRTHAVGHVVVLDVSGWLSDVVDDLDRAIRLALAEAPRGVVCDLSAVQECGEPAALAVLASAGRHARDWPGIPLAMACPDAAVRAALGAHPLGGHMTVTSSMRLALSAVLRTSSPAVESLRLAPHPTAPRASRNFVSHTLLDWRLEELTATASLLVSELVTNAMVHAGTDIDLSLATHMRALRMTVRDHSAGLPLQPDARLDLHGRGLAIVAGLSRTWGVLPTADGGKVVWAVIDSASAGP